MHVSHVQTLHNQILQRIVGAQPLVDDTAETICRRRHRIIADFCDDANLKISKECSLALVRWVEHVRRHADAPASLLLGVQTDLWLETMRALRWTVSSSPSLGILGTGTRSRLGKPMRWPERWLDALDTALGLDNAGRVAALTRGRAH